MKWAELDLNTGIWTKEAKDMKNRLAHIVPLSRQAKALLEELKPFSGHHEYVFWNNASGKPVSDGACRQALNRMGYKGEFTPHGWRHTASTLLHEQGFNTMWIEAQLSQAGADRYNLDAELAKVKSGTNLLDAVKLKGNGSIENHQLTAAITHNSGRYFHDAALHHVSRFWVAFQPLNLSACLTPQFTATWRTLRHSPFTIRPVCR